MGELMGDDRVESGAVVHKEHGGENSTSITSTGSEGTPRYAFCHLPFVISFSKKTI